VTIPPPPPQAPSTFEDVFKAELSDIAVRRDRSETKEQADPSNLVGLALSGGGIRSATFSLGVLQALHRLNLLGIFDYLSTVSGGGYTGGWWSAWLSRKENKWKGLFPDEEKIAYERSAYFGKKSEPGLRDLPDSAASAGKDPIHHLRLFSNYLTPRKGLLSADTWRATAVISRNLVLTWLVFVPILIAALLVGQFYFTLQPESNIEFTFPKGRTPYSTEFLNRDAVALASFKDSIASQIKLARRDSAKADSEKSRLYHARIVSLNTEDSLNYVKRAGNYYLINRAEFALWPLLAIFGWIVMLTTAWMQCVRDNAPRTRRRILGVAPATGFVVALLILWLFRLQGVGFSAMWKYVQQHPYHIGFGATLWFIIAYGLLINVFKKKPDLLDAKIQGHSFKEILRNRIVNKHATLLVTFAITFVVLLFAGFGGYMMRVIIDQSNPEGLFGKAILQNGGPLAILASLAAAIYTSVVVSPKGGSDHTKQQAPSGFRNLILLVAPTLVLLVMLAESSWLTTNLLGSMDKMDATAYHLLTRLAFVGISVLFFYAATEIEWEEGTDARRWRWSLISVALVIAAAAIYLALQNPTKRIDDDLAAYWFVVVIMIGAGLVYRVVLYYPTGLSPTRVNRPLARMSLWLKGHKPMFLVGLLLLAAGVNELVDHLIDVSQRYRADTPEIALLSCAGLIIVLTFILFEIRYARSKRNVRTFATLALLYSLLTLMQMLSFFVTTPSTRLSLMASTVTLISLAISFVAVVGWMIDPNAISIHTFYKARLVRAYLGASNRERGDSQEEIYDAVQNDDINLKDLENCSQGGPLHLIQTTLNLVAGNDLATAQRRSDSFLMSKRYCGSMRTGYRKTDEYMAGKLTLGTAVSTSGAAASPNMGFKTPGSSLVMLMSLLNIRLGYWAPTPNKAHWKSPQPRLWPYYMIRELLSQTNEQTTYCYLTDGGHFDNTGLYPLIQRACKFIVVCDNGADRDPPSFDDLGNAIRRARIDFGAEFDLDLTPLIPGADGNNAQHFIVGKITYSEAHVTELGWRNTDRDSRQGTIIVIKPSMTASEKVDVLQYKRENDAFPDNSLPNQWFDEAEFESYRKLGDRSVMQALEIAQKYTVEATGSNALEGYDADHIKNLFGLLSKLYARPSQL